MINYSRYKGWQVPCEISNCILLYRRRSVLVHGNNVQYTHPMANRCYTIRWIPFTVRRQHFPSNCFTFFSIFIKSSGIFGTLACWLVDRKRKCCTFKHVCCTVQLVKYLINRCSWLLFF